VRLVDLREPVSITSSWSWFCSSKRKTFAAFSVSTFTMPLKTV